MDNDNILLQKAADIYRGLRFKMKYHGVERYAQQSAATQAARKSSGTARDDTIAAADLVQRHRLAVPPHGGHLR